MEGHKNLMKIKMNIICVFNLILWSPEDRDGSNFVRRWMLAIN